MQIVQRILLGLVLLLWVLPVFSQNDSCSYVLKGQVFDRQTEEPLGYVNVRIEGTTIGTVSAEDGSFEIRNLCQAEYDLIFSFVGYKEVRHHHDFYHPDLSVYLAPVDVQLEGVAIEAEANRSDLRSGTSSKLGGEELDRVRSESLGEAVQGISGVNALSTGQNIVTPVIHGLHSNRILVVNNGLRHEFQNWSTDHAPEIDPSLAASMEVIKGASTVRFGPNAMGGVLLINPAKMELSQPWDVSFGLTAKSNGRSGEGQLKVQRGYKWISFLAEAAYLKQGDLHAPNYNLTNTGKEELSYSAGLRLHPSSNLDFELYYSNFEQELGILRGAVNGNLNDLQRALEADVPNDTRDFSYNIAPPKQEVAHDLVKVKGAWIGKQQSFNLLYGYQLNRRQEFDVRRGSRLEVPNINLELATHSLDLDWRHPKLGKFTGKFGVQWQLQDNRNIPGTNTVPFVPNFEQQQLGVYLIEAIELGQNTLEAGVRFDYQQMEIAGRTPSNNIFRNELDYQNITATIGFFRELSERSSFRSNIGTAWRAPTIAELYRFGRHLTFIEYGLWRYEVTAEDQITASRVLSQSDRAVPSEKGYKWINTYEYLREDLQMEFTGYVNYIENYIYARPAGLTRTVRGTTPFFIYDQTDALIWGIDATVRREHNAQFKSEGQLSYLWSQQVEDGDNFVGQPPVRLSYSLHYEPDWDWIERSRFSARLDYYSEQFQAPRTIPVEVLIDAGESEVELFANDASDFDIADPPSGYFLLDLGWEANLGPLSWRLALQNALNNSYRNYTNRVRYFADEPGLNVILSLNYKI